MVYAPGWGKIVTGPAASREVTSGFPAGSLEPRAEWRLEFAAFSVKSIRHDAWGSGYHGIQAGRTSAPGAGARRYPGRSDSDCGFGANVHGSAASDTPGLGPGTAGGAGHEFGAALRAGIDS